MKKLFIDLIAYATLLLFLSNSLNARYIQFPEIIYIHTDRDNYYSGDTLWFKAYILNALSLEASSKSKILYTYIYNENGEEFFSNKHIIRNGKSEGYFCLPDSLPSGNYIFIAYTNYLQNTLSDNIFSKQITFKNKKSINANIIISFSDKVYDLSDTISGTIEVKNEQTARYSGVDLSLELFQSGKSFNKLELNTGKHGIVNFRIIIPDNLTDSAIYLKSKIIKSVIKSNVSILVPFKQTPPSLQFFPESGKYLANKENVIAFKAMNVDGSPVDIVAQVIDKEGTIKKTIASTYMGMGKFNLKYATDDSLFCKIIKPISYSKKYYLPIAETNACSFNVYQNDTVVKIKLNTNMPMPDRDFKITLMMKDKLLTKKTILINQKDTVLINTEEFPSGIAIIGLSTLSGNLLAERAVFINKNKISLSKTFGIKNKYKMKDKVHFLINLNPNGYEKDPFNISLSVSLVRERDTLISNKNILSVLLLENEIKGEVFNPGFYFSKSKASSMALDLLLLTQAWRKIIYTDNSTEAKDEIKNVNFDKCIAGRVVKPNGKPVGFANLTMINYKTFSIVKTKADKNGKFAFSTIEYLSVCDTNNIVITATSPKGSKKVKILLDTMYANKIISEISAKNNNRCSFNYYQSANYYKNTIFTDSSFFKFSDDDILIKDVEVKAKRIPVIPKELYTKKYITYELKEEDIKFSVSGSNTEPFLRLIQKAAGNFIIAGNDGGKILFRGYNSIIPGNQQGAIIVVDGVFMGFNYKILDGLNPLDVESIKVTKSAGAGLRYSAYATGGLIEITTKSGFKPQESTEPVKSSINLTYLPGFQVEKVYYSPVYKNENKHLDKRKTIYWNPNLKFDYDGVTDISFYTSDISGKYLMKFEGISKNGRVFYLEKYFFVE